MAEQQTNAHLVTDFNMPLSITDKTSRHQISKNAEDLKNSINRSDLTDIYKTKDVDVQIFIAALLIIVK